jgi:hypothetical protein
MMCVKLLQQKENGLYKEMGCVCIICAYTWCECECRIIAKDKDASTLYCAAQPSISPPLLRCFTHFLLVV